MIIIIITTVIVILIITNLILFLLLLLDECEGMENPLTRSAQLLISLILLTIITTLKYNTTTRKIIVVSIAILVIWLTLMGSEYNNRNKLQNRVRIESVNSYVRNRFLKAENVLSPIAFGACMCLLVFFFFF